ncbi:type II toxin-antitoxin system TacA family antitoxin [Pseudomonas sp. LB3P14]
MSARTESIEKTKPVPINMRTDEKKRNLIDLAAAMSGRDRTSFILEAACQKAEEVILDKRLFLLDDVAFDAFEQAIEANPIRGNKCLHQLLERPKRWS